MVFLRLTLDFDGTLLTENVQASLQRVFFRAPSLDLNFLDDVLGVPEGALIVIVFMALLMILLEAIPVFFLCSAL